MKNQTDFLVAVKGVNPEERERKEDEGFWKKKMKNQSVFLAVVERGKPRREKGSENWFDIDIESKNFEKSKKK